MPCIRVPYIGAPGTGWIRSRLRATPFARRGRGGSRSIYRRRAPGTEETSGKKKFLREDGRSIAPVRGGVGWGRDMDRTRIASLGEGVAYVRKAGRDLYVGTTSGGWGAEELA